MDFLASLLLFQTAPKATFVEFVWTSAAFIAFCIHIFGIKNSYFDLLLMKLNSSIDNGVAIEYSRLRFWLSLLRISYSFSFLTSGILLLTQESGASTTISSIGRGFFLAAIIFIALGAGFDLSMRRLIRERMLGGDIKTE